MPSKIRVKVEELAAKWRARLAADPELAKLSLETVRAPGMCVASEGGDEVEPLLELIRPEAVPHDLFSPVTPTAPASLMKALDVVNFWKGGGHVRRTCT